MNIPGVERTKKAVAILILMGIVIGFLALSAGSVVGRDSILFWATGRLLSLHQNPYDAEAVFRLVRSAGSQDLRSTVTPLYEPPFALFLAPPLDFFRHRWQESFGHF